MEQIDDDLLPCLRRGPAAEGSGSTMSKGIWSYSPPIRLIFMGDADVMHWTTDHIASRV